MDDPVAVIERASRDPSPRRLPRRCRLPPAANPASRACAARDEGLDGCVRKLAQIAWWSLPGGRREPGETIEDTLRRELLEEACAQVRTSELVGFQRFCHLTGERARRVTTDAMFWVRVDAQPFEPDFETRARRLLSLAAARDLALWANPITQRLLARAAEVESRYAQTTIQPS